MEARIEKLEEFVIEARALLTKIETRLDRAATKADLVGLDGSMDGEIEKDARRFIRWTVGTAIGLVGVGTALISLALKYAPLPENPPVVLAQPAPVIILLQPYPAPLPRQ